MIGETEYAIKPRQIKSCFKFLRKEVLGMQATEQECLLALSVFTYLLENGLTYRQELQAVFGKKKVMAILEPMVKGDQVRKNGKIYEFKWDYSASKDKTIKQYLEEI